MSAPEGKDTAPPLVRQAPHDVGEELRAASYLEPAIQHRDVLVHGRLAQAEACGDLLLAVAFDETCERLSQARRQPLGRGLRVGRERTAQQLAELVVDEVQKTALARRVVGIAVARLTANTQMAPSTDVVRSEVTSCAMRPGRRYSW